MQSSLPFFLEEIVQVKMKVRHKELIKITSTEKPSEQESSKASWYFCLGCTEVCWDKVLHKALSKC